MTSRQQKRGVIFILQNSHGNKLVRDEIIKYGMKIMELERVG